jgi:hypothetical protein
MNYLKNLFIALFAGLLFVSCDQKIETPQEKPPLPEDGIYTGTFTVAPGTAEEFSLQDAGVEFTVDAEDATVGQIKMLEVQFAEKMPNMDITIPGVTLTSVANSYTIGGEGIVPFATMFGQETPKEEYTITGLEGTATAGELTFEMMCGTYPISFTGTRIPEE